MDLFFVLSGFLIGGILLYARGADNYFKVFYTRRFFRILPIYAAVLVLFPLFLRVAQIRHLGEYSWLASDQLPWVAFLTFTQSFWMAGRNTLGANLFAVTWSLAIEEQFYLTLPAVIRVATERDLVTIVVTGICVAPTVRVAALFVRPDNWVARFALLPCRMETLLLGVLAAILLRQKRWWDIFRQNDKSFGVVLVVLSCGMAYLSTRAYYLNGPLMQSVGYTWVALFYVTLLVFVLTHPQSFVSAIFRHRLLRSLGMIAYGTYLLHQGIQGFVFGAMNREPLINTANDLMAALASLAITFLLATLSWRYFETPLVRMGHRINYASASPSPELLLDHAQTH